MGSARMTIGKRGEDAACEYLTAHGHRIIDRNWRGGHLEIDIISLAPDGIHFVEVKTRVAPVTAAPEDNVGQVKQRRLADAAKKYLHSSKKAEKSQLFSVYETFFDVISVIFEGEKVEVTYFPQAYIPMYF